MMSRASSTGGAVPSGVSGLIPFQMMGLWLAVMTMPPSAPRCPIMIATPGVETIPSVVTRQPTLASAAAAANSYIRPDARLSQACAPVEGDRATLIRDMFDTMYDAPGRGLAAPQVGVLERLFVMDAGWKTGEKTPRVCINPRIVEPSDSVATGEEGCLSVPGVTAHVARPVQVVLEYTDETGAACRVTLTGAEAVIAQHETDHLDGIMHFDRLDADARAALLAEYEALT